MTRRIERRAGLGASGPLQVGPVLGRDLTERLEVQDEQSVVDCPAVAWSGADLTRAGLTCACGSGGDHLGGTQVAREDQAVAEAAAGRPSL